MGSLNLTMRYQSMDHYDTVFAVGKDQREELEKENKVYNLKNRKIVSWGYSLLDDMIESYEKNKKTNKEKTVLIAPSWQKDNIVDLCLDELLNKLKGHDYKIIVRPHPQHVRHMKEKFEGLKKQFENNPMIEIQTDFSSNNTVFDADLVITDWSSIGFEYAFTTLKPVLFVDTPVKVMNEHYKEINPNPFNIWIRDEVGEVVDPKKLDNVDKVVDKMLKNQKSYSKSIEKMKNEYVYNIGTSGEVGAKYIIKSVQDKIKSKKD
jgi:YidC/Oxa1 family membrane protein insertase